VDFWRARMRPADLRDALCARVPRYKMMSPEYLMQRLRLTHPNAICHCDEVNFFRSTKKKTLLTVTRSMQSFDTG
jgi:hypothetical protein